MKEMQSGDLPFVHVACAGKAPERFQQYSAYCRRNKHARNEGSRAGNDFAARSSMRRYSVFDFTLLKQGTGNASSSHSIKRRQFSRHRIVRQPDRHHDRVFRFLHLRDRCRAGLSQAVLPGVGPDRGDAAIAGHVRDRIFRAPGRLGAVRPLRRPHRPQGHAGRRAADHGRLDRDHRLAAYLCIDRHAGAAAAGPVPFRARPWAGRRMGRRGAAGHRKRAAGQARLDRHERVQVPALTVLREHGYVLLLGTLIALATFVLFYLMTVFALSWGTSALHYSRREFLLLQLFAVLFFAVTIPASAVLADRHGRRATMMLVSAAIILFGLLFAPMFVAGSAVKVTLFLSLGMALMGMTYGPLGTLLSELFPPEVRYTGSSLTFNLGGILGASLAPYAATWLASRYGLEYVGYYLSLAAQLTLAALLLTGKARATRFA